MDSKLRTTLENLLVWIVLIGSYVFLLMLGDNREPTDAERAAQYRIEYEQALKNCHDDYPYAEQIVAETGQSYAECAEWRTRIAMETWEVYFEPDD